MLSTTRIVLARNVPNRIFTPSAARAYSSALLNNPLPEIEVAEDSPGHKVSLKKEIEKAGGDAVVIGVPGAFSPACSAQMVPGYIRVRDQLPKNVFVLSVNDPFVSKAWKESIDGADKFRFLSDTKGELSKAIDMSFPAEKIFGNDRTKRFVMLVKDNKVKYVSAEPDNTGVSEATSAEGFLKRLEEHLK